jgi:hypothetical protein
LSKQRGYITPADLFDIKQGGRLGILLQVVDVNFEMPNEKSQSIQDSILDNNAPIQKNANNI